MPVVPADALCGCERQMEKHRFPTFGWLRERADFRGTSGRERNGFLLHRNNLPRIRPVFHEKLSVQRLGRIVEGENAPFRHIGLLVRDFRLGNDRHRSVEALCRIMERLPLPAVFDRAPRGDRPVVVQLPVESAHAARTLCTPAFDAHFYRHSLLELRKQKFRFDILRWLEVARHRLADAPVSAGVLLVPFEFRSARENLLARRERFGHLHRRETLVAEFAAETRTVGVIGIEWTVGVPDLPVVHIALGVVLPVVGETSGACAGRARPEHARRVVFCNHPVLRGMALLELGLVETGIRSGLGEPLERADAFVVAAPQGYRRMVAQAPQLMGKF